MGHFMKYFVGTYENKVDTKGRVSLPSAFRDVLVASDSTFYVFRSPNINALEAGGKDLMDFINSSIEENAPMFSEEEHIYNYIIANTCVVSYDKTGRFVLPKELVEFANISDKAVFVGHRNRFQIWNPDMHTQSFAQHRQQFATSGLTLKKPSKGVGG